MKKIGETLTTERGTGKIICIVQPKGSVVGEYLVYYIEEDTTEWIKEIDHGQ